MKKWQFSLFFVLTMILIGCGGGGSDGPANEEPPNNAPVANAGPNQNVVTGSSVTLDGSGSFDADGAQLSYSWSFVSRPSGSQATLSNPAAVAPTFTADVDGQYEVRLVVSDGQLNSLPDSVTITAATLNSVPVANAGPNQNVLTGSLVALDGSGSFDADGAQLSYSWSFVSRPSGSQATLSNSALVNPTFTADMDGLYEVHLVVNNGQLSSTPDSVTITAATQNVAPVANAGPNQTVIAGTLVTLDGSGSFDTDGDPLSYSWSFVSRPSGSQATLSNPAAVAPTFTADMEGLYEVRLVVSDGQLSSPPDAVTITATVDYGNLFTKTPFSNAVKLNDVYAAGSQFELTVTNTSDITFICTRAELFSGTVVLGFTEDSAILGEQVGPNESVGVGFTLNTSVQDDGFEFRYYFTRPDTGETFVITHLYE